MVARTPFRSGPKDHGRAAEKKVARRLGGLVVPGSGCIPGLKGDVDLPHFRLESKSTVNASLSIKYQWLVKIGKEARDVSKEPGLVVQFVDANGSLQDNGSWVMVPERLFREIFGNANAS